jgi:hypothetical protein
MVTMTKPTIGPIAIYRESFNCIGHIKKHDAAGSVIIAPGKVNFYKYDMKEKCIEPLKTISNREKKIADLPGRGLDSKSIAKLLY